MSSSYCTYQTGTASSSPREITASPTNKQIASNIVNTLWYMKRNAYSERYIKAVGKRLRHLAKISDLSDPENVKDAIARKNCSNAFKETLIEAYDLYCRANGIQWFKPFYKRDDRLPKIPKEEYLNMIIAYASRKMALILSIIKDLGLRPIEVTWLRLRDIDLETGIINITSAKHCIGRTLKLSSKTLSMLKEHVTTKKLSVNDLLFPIRAESIAERYRKIRNKLSEKLKDPQIRTIRLYDFRHWKATMEYHRTRDLLYVKNLLGHRDLRTTLRYTRLIDFPPDEYHSAIAKTIEEARRLVETGYEYVCEIDGVKLFRKRK